MAQDTIVTQHPLQSNEWGKFREKTGVKVVRENGLQVTIHKVPKNILQHRLFSKRTIT